MTSLGVIERLLWPLAMPTHARARSASGHRTNRDLSHELAFQVATPFMEYNAAFLDSVRELDGALRHGANVDG